jgi:hypothetical protein
MQETFVGEKWHMQSARMCLSSYNRVLTIGADNTGLFLVPFILFRAWHPPLFVPWTEITVRKSTQLFFFKSVVLTLGRSEQIPLRIRPRLAAKIEAAGPGWPLRPQRGIELPPPIG